MVPVAQGGVDVTCEGWGFVVEWVVVLIRVLIGDASNKLVPVVDVEDRDGVV